MELTAEQRSVFAELELIEPTDEFEPCALQRVALVAAGLSAMAAAASTIKLILEPDPTTISKWAAAANVAAILAAFMNWSLAYQTLIACEQQHLRDEAHAQEIQRLKWQQEKLQEAIDKLKQAVTP